MKTFNCPDCLFEEDVYTHEDLCQYCIKNKPTMAKYKVNDELKLSQGNDTVKLKIIFVPPLDGYNRQYYLCKVNSLHYNGGDKHFYDFKTEKSLDENFIFRY